MTGAAHVLSGDTNGNDELDLTETWLYEATGEAITGQYNNLGTAVGTDRLETMWMPRTMTVTKVQAPALTLSRRPMM